MSVNTDIFILSYNQGKFQKATPLENFQMMRFDDGIYGQIWDKENGGYPQLKNKFMTDYNVNEEEFDLLQFHNFPCEDLYEPVTGEELKTEMSFDKVPQSKVTKPGILKDILLKVYAKEKQKIKRFEKNYFDDAINNPRNEVFKRKTGLGDLFKMKDSVQSRFEEMEKRTKDYFLTRPVTEFLDLIGLLIGCLTILEQNNDEIQIVFCTG